MLCVTLFIFSTEIRRMYKCVSHGYEITRSETCIGMERNKSLIKRKRRSVPMTEVLTVSYLPHDESGRKDTLSTVYRSS